MNSSINIINFKSVCENLENATAIEFLALISKGETRTASVLFVRLQALIVMPMLLGKRKSPP